MKTLKQIYSEWLERKALLFDNIIRRHREVDFRSSVGFIDPTATIRVPDYYSAPKKLFFYEHTDLDEGARFIISQHSEKGKFIMMPHSEVAAGLTVITNTHSREIGVWFGDTEKKYDFDINKDIVIEEDAWLGANVTLVVGAHVGRGAVIGAGSVCNRKIPPYAVAMGNPAKIIGFVFTPDEAIEHEEKLYPEEKRLRHEVLERNYRMYYTERLDEIKDILK